MISAHEASLRVHRETLRIVNNSIEEAISERITHVILDRELPRCIKNELIKNGYTVGLNGQNHTIIDWSE